MYIFFVGYMGAGKSSLAKKVAKKLNWPFIDMDHALEIQFACSISEFFQEKGEAAFRLAERDYLLQLPTGENKIIATGGGVPCFQDNMKHMNSLGLTIYLQRPVAELENRIANSGKKRPLVDHLSQEERLQFIENHLKERESFYLQSQWILNREEQTANQIVEKIQLFLREKA